MKPCFIILTLLFVSGKGFTQCNGPGQSPGWAFPICGGKTYYSDSKPLCYETGFKVKDYCLNKVITVFFKNCYYYKFTCYGDGWFGFYLKGDELYPVGYNWILYDVTGKDPNEIFNNPDLCIAKNLNSANPTGISGQGTTKQCDPDHFAFTFFSDVFVKHDYILMVSQNIDDSLRSLITFESGNANLVDPQEPHLKSSYASCDGKLTAIKFNKQITCSSIASDGSDFEIVPHLANVIGASGIGCNGSFDVDSLHIKLDAGLPAGNYYLVMKQGTDGNTILDDCDRPVPAGEKIPLVITTPGPTKMDSLTKLTCATDTLQLVFKKKMICNTIAPDGSDFIISGPAPANMVSVAGVNCDGDGFSSKIKIKLDAPLKPGNYTITLAKGTDGNTLINECGFASAAGDAISFVVKDTVNADFSYTKKYGCINDTIDYFHNGNNGVNYWRWTFDKLRTSTQQNPVIYYGSFGSKITQLIVSNGVCFDTAMAVISLDNQLHAAFEGPSFLCPGERATFKNNSTGDGSLTWSWDFENGNTSSSQQPPPQSYIIAQTTRDAKPMLVVTNGIGCSDTASQNITISNSCLISVPNAFTPNGDGLNDYLYPLVAYKSKDLLFKVYSRFGQLVFETNDWAKRWDGKFKGQPADAGTYVWVLHYTNTDTGNIIDQKGTTVLIR